MSEPFARLRRFLRELKRRKVYRVAAVYAAVAFVLIQVADLTFVRLGLPAWTVTFTIVVAAVGFPLTLIMAWAFEVTPEGVQRTPGAELTEDEEAGADGGLRTGYKVLVGLGLLAAAVTGGWYLTGGGGESPSEVSKGTVAVMPFQVSGSGAEEWRDGMVSLLSTGLDGAAGLRAIPDRTVLATWEENGPRAREATTEEALAVARRIGAQHAVVGTATRLGSELQLSAAAYETSSGERLGQVEVAGAADSVTTLAGDLTRRVIGLLGAEAGEQLRAAGLASVTTRSDTALRAFLAGERHHRNGAYFDAVEDYQAAIRADSSFALPYARLSLIGLWHPEFQGQYVTRAYELSEQLPRRQRRLVRALHLGRVEHRTLAAADSLRRLTEAYPDDPMIWVSRGDLVYNTEIPGGLPEVERVHGRAVELDPSYSPYHAYYVQAAFVLHHDSAMAAKRVEAMPNKRRQRLFRLAFQVVFGDSTQRQQAFEAYDSVSVPDPWSVWAPLEAPEDVELMDEVLRRLLERDDVDPGYYSSRLLLNDLNRGRPDQFVRDLQRREVEGDRVASLLTYAAVSGLPMPDSLTRRYLAPDELPADPSLQRLHLAALCAINRGRTEVVDQLIERLRSEGEHGEGSAFAEREAIIQELEGFRAWKEGELERAARLLSRSNESEHVGALWRGDLYRQLGELERAEGWYRAAWRHPLSYQRLGRLYEEMDRPEDAAAAYRRFIEAWEDADEALQPRVEAARKRLKKLTAGEAEPDE